MAIAWIVPTIADLDNYLAAPAMVALKTAALGAGQANPFLEVMPSVCGRIRDEIRGCKTNVVSATENAIPPGLKMIACLLIIEAMQGRLPGVELTEGQADMLKDGRRYLERISQCDVPIATPEDPEAVPSVQSATAGVIVTARDRQATRRTMRGL